MEPLWIFMHPTLEYNNRHAAFGIFGDLPEHITPKIIEEAFPISNAYLLFTTMCPYQITPVQKETLLTVNGCFWLWPGTYHQYEGGSIDIYCEPAQYQAIVDQLCYAVNDTMKVAQRYLANLPADEEWDEELQAEIFLLGKVKKFL